MTHQCHYGPGKFEGEGAVTWLAWQAVLDGCGDEEIGRYSFFKAPLASLLEYSTADAPFCPACCRAEVEAADSDTPNGCYGFVVWEDEQGFVSGLYLDTDNAYADAIRRAEEEEADDDA